jgi:hypothetical protein
MDDSLKMEIAAVDMLKSCWDNQKRRVDKMIAVEEKQTIIFPRGYKEIEALIRIAETLIQAESKIMMMDRKGGGISNPHEGRELRQDELERLSPVAQKVGKLDIVDRNLICQLSQKFVDYVEARSREIEAAQVTDTTGEKVQDQKTADREMNAIEDFNKANAEENLTAAKSVPAPSAAGYDCFKGAPSEEILDISSEAMLKYCWVTAKKRVDRMLRYEKECKLSFYSRHKEIGVLRRIANAVSKHETEIRMRRECGLPTSPAVKRPGAMDQKLDRGWSAKPVFVRQAAEEFIKIMEGESVGLSE